MRARLPRGHGRELQGAVQHPGDTAGGIGGCAAGIGDVAVGIGDLFVRFVAVLLFMCCFFGSNVGGVNCQAGNIKVIPAAFDAVEVPHKIAGGEIQRTYRGFQICCTVPAGFNSKLRFGRQHAAEAAINHVDDTPYSAATIKQRGGTAQHFDGRRQQRLHRLRVISRVA